MNRLALHLNHLRLATNNIFQTSSLVPFKLYFINRYYSILSESFNPFSFLLSLAGCWNCHKSKPYTGLPYVSASPAICFSGDCWRRSESVTADFKLFTIPNFQFKHVCCCVFCVQRYPVVMSTYLGVTGRILLQNSGFFTSLLTQMAVEFNQEVRMTVRLPASTATERMGNFKTDSSDAKHQFTYRPFYI